MAIVELHPDAQKRPYLRDGQYGPGLTLNADCQVVDYQFPADETPGWDVENRENREDWCFIRIRVKSGPPGASIVPGQTTSGPVTSSTTNPSLLTPAPNWGAG